MENKSNVFWNLKNYEMFQQGVQCLQLVFTQKQVLSISSKWAIFSFQGLAVNVKEDLFLKISLFIAQLCWHI